MVDLKPVMARKDGDFTYIFTKIIDLPEFVQVEKRSDFMQSCRNFGTVMHGRKFLSRAEAQSKEKQGVLDPMPEFTIASPYVTLGSTPTHLPWVTLCQSQPVLNPVPESTLSPSAGVWNLDLPSGSGKSALSRCDTNQN